MNGIPRDDGYLDRLNPAQLEAVKHSGSPLLILAGAGSGKTRVITTKIAWLVRERGMEPESILAVTFTNKAAREMRERAAAIEPECSRAILRTFHSFGAWFLRRNAAAAGLDSNFVIYDDDDSASLLHAALPQYTKKECSRFCSAIARAKDYGLACDAPDLSEASAEPEFRRIYATYEERLKRTGNVDFGDLIRLPTVILRNDEVIRRRTRQRFRVILVDEYQDSNVAQFELLKELAGDSAYVCVVGDDDQSIYRFRGAEIRNILEFPRIFPGTTIIKLERNYRSYQNILDIAGEVVARNEGRLGKTLVAERIGGTKPRLALLDDQNMESSYCGQVVKEHVKAGGRLSDIAILYRTNAQSLGFEKDFPRMGIPYRIVGALRFYEREEVKDVLAWLSFMQNPRDEIAFTRIANKPTRGLGDTALESIVDRAGERGLDLMGASEEMSGSLKGRAKTGIAEFLRLAKIFRSTAGLPMMPPDRGAQKGEDDVSGTDSPGTAETAETGSEDIPDIPYSVSDGGAAKPEAGSQSLALLVEAVATRSGLAEYHRSQDEVAGTQKLANLDELVNAASLYPLSAKGLSDFLETIELDRSLSAEESGAEAVTLITMHNTKGLEFPFVIVTGLEQGLFPRDDEDGEDLEEQRRLFYVAITRAKDKLLLTACRWRTLHGRLFETSPSRFLSEISPGRLEIVGSKKTSLLQGKGGYASSQMPARSGTGYGAQTASYPGSGRPRAVSGPAKAPEQIWHAGMAVYHDEYGAGVILKVSPTPSAGPLVVVRFETGKQAQFFPKFTTKLEAWRS